jgi:serine/threonine protein kinase
MKRFDYNTKNYFEKYKKIISKDNIYKFGIQIINILENVHKADYIYNDLKLDNLLFDYYDYL